MPRKKVESEVAEPVAAAPATETGGGVSYSGLTVERGALPDDADMNGDGHISKREMEMHLEFRRKELEDADAMRDAQRNMTWFALFGLLLYPFAVVGASLAGLDEAQKTLGSMAPTYFVAVAGIVAAFFGAQAYSGKTK